MKTYFKGCSGIVSPIDIEGNNIKEDDILTRDYGDYESYMHKQVPDHYKVEPFYIVKKNDKGEYYANSIVSYTDYSSDKEKFLYLHDFRFKYCRLIK